LCWADAGTKKIECIGVQSGFRRTIASDCSYPFSIAISDTHYYWTDWVTKKVESALRPHGQPSQALDVPLGSSGNLFGAVVVPTKCPVIFTRCQSSDACPQGYLCLPNGRGSRSCLCPDENEEDEEGVEKKECNDII
jgi:nidogen (entactin)